MGVDTVFPLSFC